MDRGFAEALSVLAVFALVSLLPAYVAIEEVIEKREALGRARSCERIASTCNSVLITCLSWQAEVKFELEHLGEVCR